ncbi:MAG: hypothetical protein ACAH17_02560 [Candidatus Paceibacterota bacterium]
MQNSSNLCGELHAWANSLELHSFPYDESKIPVNGIYILFEKGELGHGGNRIVRIGTHTGNNQLRSRLRQHFLASNKDRSIFRKNIGRCLLNKTHDLYLPVWELDMTTKLARDTHGKKLDNAKQKNIEQEITAYMQKNFFFSVIQVGDKDERLSLESKIISTVSHCAECKPSKKWLGLFSPKEKIKESGLWLVNELYKEPLTSADLQNIKKTRG